MTAAYLQIAQELALQASETGETAAVQDLEQRCRRPDRFWQRDRSAMW